MLSKTLEIVENLGKLNAYLNAKLTVFKPHMRLFGSGEIHPASLLGCFISSQHHLNTDSSGFGSR